MDRPEDDAVYILHTIRAETIRS